MNKTDKLTPHQRIVMLSAIAERDKTISELKQEVKHYKRQYEIAVRRKLHERHERTERRKDRIALAVLLCVIAFVFIPIAANAIQQTVLRAAGMCGVNMADTTLMIVYITISTACVIGCIAATLLVYLDHAKQVRTSSAEIAHLREEVRACRELLRRKSA